jgi:alkylation response protein AidB-like acyl-CoA dehydrogenase
MARSYSKKEKSRAATPHDAATPATPAVLMSVRRDRAPRHSGPVMRYPVLLDDQAALRGPFVDRAAAEPSAENVAAASDAVAEARAAATEAALHVSSKLIELAGSRATLTEFGLDRFWRNARTHSVHDPVSWKYRIIGDYWLNGINPPRHGAI